MLTPTIVLASIGLVSGLGLAIAARAFAVDVDPRQEKVNDVLPGANCGGCGYAGCADFAAGLVDGKVEVGDCPVCDDQSKALIAEIMGVEVGESVKEVALIMCQGDSSVAGKDSRYNGHASCASADLVGGGDKLCQHGCLGLADCQAVCSFGAVEITDGDIAKIIPSRCTSCGKCVAACPRNLIKMIPAETKIHVLCNNTDKGAAAKKACGVSCIGCKKCEKAFEEDPRITIHNFLAEVDYENPPTDESVVDTCPTGALTIRLMRDQDHI